MDFEMFKEMEITEWITFRNSSLKHRGLSTSALKDLAWVFSLITMKY